MGIGYLRYRVSGYGYWISEIPGIWVWELGFRDTGFLGIGIGFQRYRVSGYGYWVSEIPGFWVWELGFGDTGFLGMGIGFRRYRVSDALLIQLIFSGHFFVKYPRHGTLISINKRNTGKTNDEFNMRHDWNSLLSDDLDLRMTKYSRSFFPPKSVLVKYLQVGGCDLL